ncbi:putative plant specific mitochondrial import receptor subunit TOM20 [Helianthus anomalus]
MTPYLIFPLHFSLELVSYRENALLLPKYWSMVYSIWAPDLHNEIVKQGVFNQPQPPLGPGPAASSKAKKPANKKSSDLKYDICGWIILAVGIMAWVGMAKSHTPQ